MNHREAKAAAKRFDSVIDFVRHCGQIVDYATKTGILRDICSHMRDKETIKLEPITDLKNKSGLLFKENKDKAKAALLIP